jgi:hypothetical protein
MVLFVGANTSRLKNIVNPVYDAKTGESLSVQVFMSPIFVLEFMGGHLHLYLQVTQE